MDAFFACGPAGGAVEDDDDARASQWLCVNSCVSAVAASAARAGFSSNGERGDELSALLSMPPPPIPVPTMHEYLENQTEVAKVQDEIIRELMQRLKEQDAALLELRATASTATAPAASPRSRRTRPRESAGVSTTGPRESPRRATTTRRRSRP